MGKCRDKICWIPAMQVLGRQGSNYLLICWWLQKMFHHPSTRCEQNQVQLQWSLLGLPARGPHSLATLELKSHAISQKPAHLSRTPWTYYFANIVRHVRLRKSAQAGVSAADLLKKRLRVEQRVHIFWNLGFTLLNRSRSPSPVTTASSSPSGLHSAAKIPLSTVPTWKSTSQGLKQGLKGNLPKLFMVQMQLSAGLTQLAFGIQQDLPLYVVHLRKSENLSWKEKLSDLASKLEAMIDSA